MLSRVSQNLDMEMYRWGIDNSAGPELYSGRFSCETLTLAYLRFLLWTATRSTGDGLGSGGFWAYSSWLFGHCRSCNRQRINQQSWPMVCIPNGRKLLKPGAHSSMFHGNSLSNLPNFHSDFNSPSPHLPAHYRHVRGWPEMLWSWIIQWLTTKLHSLRDCEHSSLKTASPQQGWITNAKITGIKNRRHTQDISNI